MVSKLRNHASAQCKVITSEEQIIFRSYSTDVIIGNKLPNGKYLLEVTGLYSMTTRKQIGWFLREYFPTLAFADVKGAFEKGQKLLA